MADQRGGGIAWTEQTWNPLRGCSRVSEGCRYCYAEAVAARFSGVGQPYEGLATVTPDGPRWTGTVRVVEEHLRDPLQWKRPRMVFVNSMSDLFHESVSDEAIDRIFAVMALASTHTFQILTKRAERMLAYMTDPDTPNRVDLIKQVILAGHLDELSAPERVVDIVGWPGYYVTSKGRVLSDRTTGGQIDNAARRELKPQYGEQGHARVELQVNGRSERVLIHRVVVAHFERKADVDEQVRHLDGNPKNNALWNLAVGDQSANWDDSKRHGTRRRYSKLTMEQIDQIRRRLAAGESAYAIGPAFGVSDTQIRNIAKGKQWQPEYTPEWPLPSVWLGVSVENQHYADERIPLLLQTPAAVRFISAEPLLEAVSLRDWPKMFRNDHVLDPTGVAYQSLDWVIIGGESGPHARPFDLAWARSMVEECRVAGVACFVKQLGANPVEAWPEGPTPHHRVRFQSRKGGDLSEWPVDLRVREFPAPVEGT